MEQFLTALTALVCDKMIAQGQTPIRNMPEEAQANQNSDVAKQGALLHSFGITIES